MVVTFARAKAHSHLQVTDLNPFLHLRKALWPVSLAYGMVLQVRNWLYNKGYFATYQPHVPTISIGNLSVGGTGKTPFIETLLSLSPSRACIAVVSRGYGRTTKGLLRLQEPLDAVVYGDEPCQIKTSFPASEVIVSEDRVTAFKYIKSELPQVTHILLDDGFQHRRAQRTLNVMLTAYDAPFYLDYVLPAGNLREFRSNADRADVIIVTKCPNEIRNIDEVKNAINQYNSSCRIMFTSIEFLHIKEIKRSIAIKPGFLVLTSIANPYTIYKHLKEIGVYFKCMALRDHATYTEKTLKNIYRELRTYNLNSVLTTAKDLVKLKPFIETLDFDSFGVYLLPIHTRFKSEEDRAFFKAILN